MQDDIKINPESTPEVGESPVESKQEEPEVKKEVFVEQKIEEKDDKTVQQKPQDDDEEEVKAEKEADKMRDDKYEGRKLDQLIALVGEKGVNFAINVARKIGDPTLLDLLHDKIVEKGLHKE